MDAYEHSGRTNQKRRTRQALIQKATELVREGKCPTVAEVAEAALISKSTAYRYFASQDALLEEVRLDEILRSDLDRIAAVAVRPGAPEERLAAVVEADLAMQLFHEDIVRDRVAAWIVCNRPGSHSEGVTRRPGNRLNTVAAALQDVRTDLGEDAFQRLVMAIAMCMGIESVVVLKDICGLDEDALCQVKVWAANALLQAALREAEDPLA
ncbi:MAG: TetR/AcrR family transcriptional regulator [Thermomicrobiales bacterium]